MEFYWDIIDDYTMILYCKEFEYPLIQSHYENDDDENLYYINGICEDFIDYEFIVYEEDIDSIENLQEIIIQDLTEYVEEERTFWKDVLYGLNNM